MNHIQRKYVTCTCGHTRHNHSDKPYVNAQTRLPMHPCRVAECKCPDFRRKDHSNEAQLVNAEIAEGVE